MGPRLSPGRRAAFLGLRKDNTNLGSTLTLFQLSLHTASEAGARPGSSGFVHASLPHPPQNTCGKLNALKRHRVFRERACANSASRAQRLSKSRCFSMASCWLSGEKDLGPSLEPTFQPVTAPNLILPRPPLVDPLLLVHAFCWTHSRIT